ncbi:BNR-4 repeat-containing protein [Bdellovibrio bacteriovorus]|uniref:BNR-4 repeat-containing protein n=1 Tax=Bdellovibrio bacteriovorus TaxID=959 RepID=UPI0035A738EC
MKKVIFFLLIAFIAVSAYYNDKEGQADFASSNRTFTPIKLPALPKSGLNSFNTAAEAYNFQESQHERNVFHWTPGFPVYIPAFDSQNRAYLRQHERSQTTALTTGFVRYDGGGWTEIGLGSDFLKDLYPKSNVDELTRANRQDLLWDPKMAVFDRDDIMYTPLRIKEGVEKSYVVAYSKDYGRSWKALNLLTESTLPEWYDLERPTSVEALPGPPAFLYYQATGKAPGYERGFEYWQGTVGKLTFQMTHFKQGELVKDLPVVLSKNAQPIGYRSGSGVKILRSKDKYFITWLEATLDHKMEKNERGRVTNSKPDKAGNPYSAIWIAEVDVKTRNFKKTEILKTWPLNDSHNQPAIVRSQDGTLHVIGGAHGAHFTYTRSLKPDSIDSWSPSEYVNTTDSGYSANFNIPGVKGGSQTYASLVIDSQSRLHLVYRLWAHDKSVFDFEYFGALAYQSAEPDNSGKNWKWSEPKILVYPNAQEYTHYYQVLTMDRKGNLYLEYSQMRPYAPYYFKSPSGEAINTSPMLNSALLKSEDQGKNWFLVNDKDFK